jgi:very-short-patch-repair endonuclease
MFGYNIDSLFIIKTYNPNVPSICLEIDENNHNDRDQDYEKNREEVIKSLEYRLIRYPVKRHAHTNDDELNKYIKEIVEKIKIMVKDVTTDYSLSLSSI